VKYLNETALRQYAPKTLVELLEEELEGLEAARIGVEQKLKALTDEVGRAQKTLDFITEQINEYRKELNGRT
jgi:predicted  nucleic acid-binding Zn-ribbon protein